MFETNGRAPAKTFGFVTRLVPGLAMISDSIVLILAGALTYRFLVGYSEATYGLYWTAIVFNWLVTIALLYFGGLYRLDPLCQPIAVIDRLILAPVTTFLLLLAAAFSIKQSEPLSRIWGASLLPTTLVLLFLSRSLLALGLRRVANARTFMRSMVIVGEGQQLSQLLHYFAETNPRFVKISGLFLTGGDEPQSDIPVLGRGDDVVGFLRQQLVDDVVIAMPWSEDKRIKVLVDKLRELPVSVYLGADIIGFSVSLRPPPNFYESMPLSQVTGDPLGGWDIVIKTVEDYVLGVVAIIVLSPIMLAAAIAVRLSGPGPILFRQERLGFNNKRFFVYKFRSMTHRPNEAGPTVQARAGDARVTSVGRFLRRTSIDELPQLLNVMNGTMSLVGPRPHAVDHNEEYGEKIRGYFARHRVKPGITGLAQVNGYRGPTDTVDKMAMRVKYDIQYTDNWSPTLDLKILIRTAYACIRGENAV